MLYKLGFKQLLAATNLGKLWRIACVHSLVGGNFGQTRFIPVLSAGFRRTRRAEHSRNRKHDSVSPLSVKCSSRSSSPSCGWGKALFISSSRGAYLAALHSELQREDWPCSFFLSPSLFFSRSLALSLSHESAAILYIAKSFTISLGTFIIPQLNPPCFVAERYRGRFNLSFHLAPDYPPDYTIPTTLLFPLPPPRLVQNVLLRSSVLVRLSPNHPKLTARRNEILFSD